MFVKSVRKCVRKGARKVVRTGIRKGVRKGARKDVRKGVYKHGTSIYNILINKYKKRDIHKYTYIYIYIYILGYIQKKEVPRDIIIKLRPWGVYQARKATANGEGNSKTHQ